MEDSSASKPTTVAQEAKKPRQWGILTGTLWVLLAFLGPSYLLGLILRYVVRAHINIDSLNAAESLVLEGGLDLAAFAIILVIIRLYRQNLASIRLVWPKRLSLFGWTLVAFVGYFVGSTLATAAVGLIFPQVDLNQVQDLGFTQPTLWQLPFAFIGLVIIPPIVEETLFRGFLFTGYARRLGPVLAALLVSLLFALAHGQINVGVDVFVLSLFLCYLRIKTDSLWPGIALHMLKNLVAFLFLFVFVNKG